MTLFGIMFRRTNEIIFEMSHGIILGMTHEALCLEGKFFSKR